MTKLIVIQTSFAAIHSYPECENKEVGFLTNPHRHVFHVVVKFKVEHNNRQIEFLTKKKEINQFIEEVFGKEEDIGSQSCEDIAETILETFSADFVSVYEDNENGAEIHAN